MSFYKRDGEELLVAPNFVRAPDYDLFADQKDSYTYPVDGWTWYDTLDAAMASMQTTAQTISPVQAKIILHRYGLLDTANAAVAAADVETQLAWSAATGFARTSPILNGMATTMGLTPAQLDTMFAEDPPPPPPQGVVHFVCEADGRLGYRITECNDLGKSILSGQVDLLLPKLEAQLAQAIIVQELYPSQ